MRCMLEDVAEVVLPVASSGTLLGKDAFLEFP